MNIVPKAPAVRDETRTVNGHVYVERFTRLRAMNGGLLWPPQSSFLRDGVEVSKDAWFSQLNQDHAAVRKAKAGAA